MSSAPKGMLSKAQDFYRVHKRKIVLAVGGVVGLLAMSYAMLLGTSTPGFCQLCHEMKPMFNNWQTSVHAEVGCIDCHVAPSLVAQGIHKVEAMKEMYLHLTVYNKPNAPKIYAKEHEPVNEACGRCHSMNRKFSFSGDLKVPHKKHIDAGLTCPVCHSRVVHGTPDQRKPKMELCLTCHGKMVYKGKVLTDHCPACHTKKNVPPSHTKANWFQVHGQMSKTINCGKCHNWRPDWCMQCHKRKPPSHVAGKWRGMHGQRAKVDRASCNACHKLEFCMRCHGVQP